MKYFELQMGGFSATLFVSGHGSMKKRKINAHDYIDFPWTLSCQTYYNKTVTLHLTNINLSGIYKKTVTLLSGLL